MERELRESNKDNRENDITGDYIREEMESMKGRGLKNVRVGKDMGVRKLGTVMHLVKNIVGEAEDGKEGGELSRDMTSALHPTPAVCGSPRQEAMKEISKLESFSRGLYAGPFGIVSGDRGSEVCVGIRSAVVRGRRVYCYGGAGIVEGSEGGEEGREGEGKVRAIREAWDGKENVEGKYDFKRFRNNNEAWAYGFVEEMVRLGVTEFVVSPGSRNTPLVHAVHANPRANGHSVVDERSAGFMALGMGRRTGKPAAVITSSGTAVANLLPPVVEASMSSSPLLVVTADRPGEMIGVGANQAIHQVRQSEERGDELARPYLVTKTAHARTLL